MGIQASIFTCYESYEFGSTAVHTTHIHMYVFAE